MEITNIFKKKNYNMLTSNQSRVFEESFKVNTKHISTFGKVH